jgi:hypothetical protein
LEAYLGTSLSGVGGEWHSCSPNLILSSFQSWNLFVLSLSCHWLHGRKVSCNEFDSQNLCHFYSYNLQKNYLFLFYLDELLFMAKLEINRNWVVSFVFSTSSLDRLLLCYCLEASLQALKILYRCYLRLSLEYFDDLHVFHVNLLNILNLIWMLRFHQLCLDHFLLMIAFHASNLGCNRFDFSE